MRAVLMAGGSGTRLRPLTCDLPKPMVPILNRPIAEHIIHLLRRHHLSEIIATLHYLPDLFRDYFQDGSEFGVRLSYSVEEDRPLGTAGCVKNIEEWLTETFVVVSGDSITDFDLTAAIAFHQERQAKATLVLTRVANPLEFGVTICDRDGRISRFLEKPSVGEVFSDTINTGIYILEPDVLDLLPCDRETDFSKDLFPLLLAKNEPIYGYIAEGYWCDVGHLDAYRQVQYDALAGLIKLETAYEERSPGVWVGQNTHIDERARIQPPVLIGDNSRVGPRAALHSGTVIGDNVTICASADLQRTILWSGVIVGEEAELVACTIARGARVDRRARIMEGATIGALSVVGEEARVAGSVRVWPGKQIEPGAILNLSLIWGQTAVRNLFGQRGVSGLANIDITAEFAVKLGAAYGSTLPAGSQVAVSRDQRNISRMVTRSLVSGLMSVGTNIQNLEATPLPAARAAIPRLGVAGGIHIRLHPDHHDRLLVEFFNDRGIDISKSAEKKIEGAYFKEDFRRVQINDIGDVFYPSQVVDIYRRSFEKHLNLEALRSSGAKIAIDYAYSVSGALLPQLLAKFGCEAVVLNASLNQASVTHEIREAMLLQLGRVVEAIAANFGVQVLANGEQFALVDETGNPIRGERLTALMVEVMLASQPRSNIVVPVHSSGAVEMIAHRYEAKVIRTKANPTALMEACAKTPNVSLGGCGDMGFIFPALHPGFDAMFAAAKLIETLTLQERTLGEIRTDGLPDICHQTCLVRCPWTLRGALMRYLVETHPPETIETIDGVKIYDHAHNGWVAVLPEAGEPTVRLIADSRNREWVRHKLQEYRHLVQVFLESERYGDELNGNLDEDDDKP